MFEQYYEAPRSFDEECTFNQEEVELRECFRLLWSQHVYWTRIVIMGIVFDLPDLETSTARLLNNPADFANVFRCFYGNRIATEFERLMKEHLVLAVELVKAAKAGSKAAAEIETRWYANADEIVAFMNHINPFWPVEEMRNLWHQHLAMTKDEAVAFLGKNYQKSVVIFNRIEKEALVMADEFAGGMIRQFCL